MGFRSEVIPFIMASLVLGVVLGLVLRLAGLQGLKVWAITGMVTAVFVGYFLYFFRDPERIPPTDESLIVSGADGAVAQIKEVREDKYLKTDAIRVSIFLNLFSVHVNRAPISGRSKFLGYFPGKRFFTYEEKSSDFNQHNAILIQGQKTRCLVNQIVGPVCRRVVYWPDHDREVDLKLGERIGMMKFGSRLDMYFPKDDVEVTARVGDKVAAGLSVIGTIKGGKSR